MLITIYVSMGLCVGVAASHVNREQCCGIGCVVFLFLSNGIVMIARAGF